MVIYTRLLWFAAGFAPTQSLILIHPKYRHDLPLLAHERAHQAQQKRTGTLVFWYRYLTDKGFRLSVEAEAYKVQISLGARPAACAKNIATKYRLDITPDEALQLLSTP